jgi:hypothetical protein
MLTALTLMIDQDVDARGFKQKLSGHNRSQTHHDNLALVVKHPTGGTWIKHKDVAKHMHRKSVLSAQKKKRKKDFTQRGSANDDVDYDDADLEDTMHAPNEDEANSDEIVDELGRSPPVYSSNDD